jgi:hypothetical protein
VLVKTPAGKHRTLDVRQHRLAKLSQDYADCVWKALRREANTTRAGPLRSTL